MKIIDPLTKQEVPQMGAIGRYFRLQGESLQDFMAGCKALTPADKEELARGAAKELGLQVIE